MDTNQRWLRDFAIASMVLLMAIAFWSGLIFAMAVADYPERRKPAAHTPKFLDSINSHPMWRRR